MPQMVVVDRAMKRWWSRFVGLLVFGLFILAAALTAEIALRLLMKERIHLFPQFHDAATYGEFTIRRYRPGITFWHRTIDGHWYFKINNKGFRDSEDYSLEKSGDIVRVLTLGDSHTSGYEVRQSFSYPELISRSLKVYGIQAQTLNAAISDFGTAEQLVFLENEGIRYKPDFVVVGFYANDLQDNIKANLFRLQDGELMVAKTTYTPRIFAYKRIAAVDIFRWISQNSHLYSFLINTAYDFANRALVVSDRLRLQTEPAAATDDVAEYENALMRALLRRMYSFCHARGVKLIVVDIPRVTTADEQIRSSIPEALYSDFEQNSDVLLHSWDIFASFADDPTMLHRLHGQRHISEAAHAAIAEAVAGALNRAR